MYIYIIRQKRQQRQKQQKKIQSMCK